MTDKLDFSVVVPAAQAGDEQAQNAIMEKFYGWSVLQARQVARDEERAADAAVEFWSKMLREGGIKAYTGTVPFLTWLRVRLRSHTIDWLRARRQPIVYSYGDSPVDETVGGGDDPAQAFEASELWDQIRARLTQMQAEVLGATMRGVSAQEIAKEHGVSVQHVYDVLSAARALVRDLLGE